MSFMEWVNLAQFALYVIALIWAAVAPTVDDEGRFDEDRMIYRS